MDYWDSNFSDYYTNFKSIPPAPTFEPTEEEFRDPLTYLDKIRHIGMQYGIVKVKPPPAWQPPFHVDVDNFRFTPRIQRLNELEATSRVKNNFVDAVVRFWQLQGSDVKLPVIEDKYLELYSLNNVVNKHGGYQVCCRDKNWPKVARSMGFKTHHGTMLRNYFRKVLLPYHVYKEGTALEHIKTANSPKKTSPEKGKRVPERQSSRMGMRSRNSNGGSQELKEQPSDETEKCFTPKGREMKRLAFYGAGPKLAGLPSFNSSKDSKEDCRSAREPCDPCEDHRDDTGISVASPLKDAVAAISDVFCKICDKDTSEEKLLLCDSCDKSFHTFCLLPPLSQVPKGDWRCPECVTKEVKKPTQAYGFEQGKKSYTLHTFGEMADQFKRDYFGMPCHAVPCSTVEKEFWRLIGSTKESVAVEYGADLFTQDVGSGFPRLSDGGLSGIDKEYAESPWNINNLSVLKNSVLSHINTEISGMKIPWAYVGMCFSTFCWHTEDHWSYSINYMHWGEPKTWYGIPTEEADKFENTMKEFVPELFRDHPDVLHHIVTMMNPTLLRDKGVKVTTLNQYAGEFIITFPRAYHAGFNQGYNFAEAVNFCPYDWLRIGRSCVKHYADVGRSCVFSHDELVCRIANEAENLDIAVAIAAMEDMISMMDEEKMGRKKLLDLGIKEASQELFERVDDDARQCSVCSTTCFLSGVTCSCSKGKIVCIAHVDKLCNCEPSKYCLRYRYTMDELPLLLKHLKDRCDAYNTWVKKVDTLLNCKSGSTKPGISFLKELQEEWKKGRYPYSDMSESLLRTVKTAEKSCALAKQLVAQKIRTRNKQSGISNRATKLTLPDVEEFYADITGLVCEVPEANDIKDFIGRIKQFKMEAFELLTGNMKEEPLDKFEKLYDSALSFDVQLDELYPLHQELEIKRWMSEVNEYLVGDESEGDRDVKVPKLTLKHARKLIQSGTDLRRAKPVEETLAKLQHAVIVAEENEKKAEAFLSEDDSPLVAHALQLIRGLEKSLIETPCFGRLSGLVAKANDCILKGELIKQNGGCLRTIDYVLKQGRSLPFKMVEELECLEQSALLVRSTLAQLSKLLLLSPSRYTILEALLPRRSDDDATCSNSDPSLSVPKVITCQESSDEKMDWLTKFGSTTELVQYLDKETQQDVRDMYSVRKRRREEKDSPPGCICDRNDVGICIKCHLCHKNFHVQCMAREKFGFIMSHLTSPKETDFYLTQVWLCGFCCRSNRLPLDALSRCVPPTAPVVPSYEMAILEHFQKRITDWQAKVALWLKSTNGNLLAQQDASNENCALALAELDILLCEGLLLECHPPEITALLTLEKIYRPQTPTQIQALQEWSRAQRQMSPSTDPNEPRKPKILQNSTKRKRPLYSSNSEKHPKAIKTKGDKVETAQVERLPVEGTVERAVAGAGDDPDAACSAKICIRPKGVEVDWIQCEVCDEWYHFSCVGLSQGDVEAMDTYICYKCPPTEPGPRPR